MNERANAPRAGLGRTPRAVGATLLLVAGLASACRSQSAEPATASGIPPTNDQKAQAYAIRSFRKHCMECHDADGRGKIARELFRAIPDFTDAKWQSARTDDHLRQSIIEGQGKSMPPMKARLTRPQIQQLVRFIRGFRGGAQVVPEEEDDEEVESSKRSPPETVAVKIVERRSSQRPAPSAGHPGAALFQRSCRACHGSDGRGATLRAGGMPSIPDFTSADWQSRRRPAQLTASILEGKGRQMPGFRDSLSIDQVRSLVDYIRTLGPTARGSSTGQADDFEGRLRELQKELETLRRQQRALMPPPPRK